MDQKLGETQNFHYHYQIIFYITLSPYLCIVTVLKTGFQFREEIGILIKNKNYVMIINISNVISYLFFN